MKSLLASICFFIVISFGNAQVGIGTTNPQATLDIEASNPSSPINNDGVLIPRVSNLTAPASMTANQDGMLVFYIGSGYSGKGFYYWDQTTTNWIFLNTGGQNNLDQAYDEGGAGVGKSITADTGAVQINGSDGLLVTGTYNSGSSIDTEVTGAGTRMFFNPRKAAFRAGTIDNLQWNDANIGAYSTAFGRNNTANGANSTAFGFGNIASSTYATTFGYLNTAIGTQSLAFGSNTFASGIASTSFGSGSTASGIRSTAFGYNTVASQTNALAFGNASIASGNTATSFGQNTTASGAYATAFGYNTLASENQSTAFGNNTTASGNSSTAFGIGTDAPGTAETAIGIYNTLYNPASTAIDRLFVVGNGNTGISRSNALTVYTNGLMNINDEYNMPLTDGTAGQVITTDGVGNLSFTTISSNKALTKLRPFNNSQQSGYTKIDFTATSVDFDLTNNFNISSDRFTASSTGYYRVNANIKINTTSSNASSTYGFAIYRNGALLLEKQKLGNGTAASPFNIGIDTIIYLSSGQYIEFYTYKSGVFPATYFSFNTLDYNWIEIQQVQ